MLRRHLAAPNGADHVERHAATFLARGIHAVDRGHYDELHAMRIAGKRLRYNIEFFSERLAPEKATALGLMALIQDRLGAVADADALLKRLGGIVAALEQDDPRRKGLAHCVTAARAEREQAIAAIRSLWTGDGHAPYPDMLAAAVATALASSSSKDG